jgi:hypothetical protein
MEKGLEVNNSGNQRKQLTLWRLPRFISIFKVPQRFGEPLTHLQ